MNQKKKQIDADLCLNTVLRVNGTLQNYLKVPYGNDIYNLPNFYKIQITDTTISKYPNDGKSSLQKWKNIYSDMNGNRRLNIVKKTKKTSSPTGDSGATTIPPLENSFMYVETSLGGHGFNVFVSFVRTDVIQNSNITFY